jgi:hypothetical protein
MTAKLQFGMLCNTIANWCRVGAIAIALLGCHTQAQPYALREFVISSGGVNSTNALFNIKGTFGQPYATQLLQNQRYTLSGGFWSTIMVVPTPNSPELTITLVGDTIVLSWSILSLGFVVQVSDDLSNWHLLPGQPSPSGSTFAVFERILPGQRFYRLKRLP